MSLAFPQPDPAAAGVEELLREAAEWTPETPVPEGLAARALLASRAPKRRLWMLRRLAWALPVAGFAAVAAFAFLRSPHGGAPPADHDSPRVAVAMPRDPLPPAIQATDALAHRAIVPPAAEQARLIHASREEEPSRRLPRLRTRRIAASGRRYRVAPPPLRRRRPWRYYCARPAPPARTLKAKWTMKTMRQEVTGTLTPVWIAQPGEHPDEIVITPGVVETTSEPMLRTASAADSAPAATICVKEDPE